MKGSGNWSDLARRAASGAVLALAGGAALVAGGWPFAAAICLVCGAIVWEAARMHASPGAALDGSLAGLAGLAIWALPWIFAAPLAAAAAIVVASRAGRARAALFGVVLCTLAAGIALAALREGGGLAWALWAVCVVAASDVAGYAAGRALGGPKLWPRVSPAKTWSGAIAGWIAAAAAGAAFAGPTGAGGALIPMSMLLCAAAQAGDIAESALKRSAGVKDSSGLIPGHGGAFDRFDAMLGAGLALLALWAAGLAPLAR